MRVYLEARKDRRAFVRRGIAVICLLIAWTAVAAAQSTVAELVNPGNTTDDQFGSAFAFSGDGGTLLVGAPTGTGAGGIGGAGRVDVYTRQNGVWTQTAELLLPAALGPRAGDRFGSAVALSADGTLALVGAPGRNLGLGAFETFELLGGAWTWTSEVASSAVHQANLGAAVALSGDGLTAVVAAPAENNGIGNCGVIHVYAQGTGSWKESPPISVGSACTVSPFDTSLGRSLALSRDGSTIAATVEIMCVDVVPPCGAAHVFVRNSGNGSWTEQARLATSNTLYFGQSASLSGDGSTAAFGGGIGGYIFERNGSVWTQTLKVDGGSMSLSEDGLSLLAGVTGPNAGVDLYTRTATEWIKALRIPNPEPPPNNGFGVGVVLSANGSTAAVWNSNALRPGIGYFGKAYTVALASVIDTPTLNDAGLAALAVLLAAAGAFALRRRRLS